MQTVFTVNMNQSKLYEIKNLQRLIMKLILIALFLQSCAIVHHVQVGEVRHKKNYQRIPFDIKVSETGFSVKEAADVVDAISGDSKASELADIIAMFQVGPTTGKPIYNPKYADKIAKSIYKKCPTGDITGLLLVRETASYPVVSGEIVKVKGYCLIKK